MKQNSFIIPAIDLIDGRCVRLFQGDFDQRTDYPTPPLMIAEHFAQAGAEWLHVVDLDGARHEHQSQAALIIRLAQKTGLHVQAGGGIRHTEHIHRLLENGIRRVVIGSLAITNPKRVYDWLEIFDPKRIVLAFDVHMRADKTPVPATRGWQTTGIHTLWDCLDMYTDSRLKTILVTDISRDGVLNGANMALYQQCQSRFEQFDIIASGGIGTVAHVQALKTLKPHGIIIGKALYENCFSLQEALTC